jgi:uncharacterized protein
MAGASQHLPFSCVAKKGNVFMKGLMFTALAFVMTGYSTMVDAQTAQYTHQMTGTRLDLTARGESLVVPNVALVTAGVQTNAADAATAMRNNADQMARVMAALKKSGIPEKDIQTQSINLSAQYRYEENKPPIVTGYQATNAVTVRFRDISKSGAILDTLVREGANQINGPTLIFDNPAAAHDAARMQAMKTLQSRAQAYAKSVGMSVKRIVAITENADQGGAPMPVSAFASDAAESRAKTTVSAGEQSIGVTVSAVFELQ